jgi:hypothetical protein
MVHKKEVDPAVDGRSDRLFTRVDRTGDSPDGPS